MGLAPSSTVSPLTVFWRSPHKTWASLHVLSQGLQDDIVDSDEPRVYNPYLGRSVRAFLFMDDTTLLARTKAGLQTLTQGYMNLCRKFRMRLNHGKSRVMHFRSQMRKEDLDAGFTVDGIAFSQPPRSTKAGKPKEGGCRHPYLGFLLDEAL